MWKKKAQREFGIAIVLAALSAWAQTPNATLVGRITDATGASVVGAKVRVRNLETGEIREVESLGSGEYTASYLRPGPYEVTVEAAGFQPQRHSGLQLALDQTARLDVRLEVGPNTTVVEVTDAAPLLNTENSSRGEVIAGRELTEMPLNGRDFQDLAFMVPGVQPAEQGQKGAGLSMNGARADSSNVIVDGFNNQNPRDAGVHVRPPLDSLQEFKVQTSGYSAEYGRLAGGVVNMALKSGGNELHGAIFEFVRNDVFDARNFFAADKSKLRRNQFGGTATGPVFIPGLYSGRNRTFFVVSWESYRQRQGSTQLGTVPTLLEREGDFSRTTDASGKPVYVKDPTLSGTCSATNQTACFPGNRIPASRISPISQKLVAYYPLPNRSGSVNNFIATGSSPDDWNTYLFKVDQIASGKDNLSFRIIRRDEDSLNPFAGSAVPVFGTDSKDTQHLLGVNWIRTFTPAWINEFRSGFTRTVHAGIGAHAGHDYAADFGIPGATKDPHLVGFPRITITGFPALGENTSTPIEYTVNTYQWANTMTWIRSKHNVRAGFDIIRTQFFQPTNTNFRGTFAFQNRNTGVPFADFLLGLPNSTSRRIGTATNYIFSTNYGLFVQDDYKVTPSLTINLGLRYELSIPPYEKYGQMTNFVPGLNKLVLADVVMAPDYQATVAKAGLVDLVVLARDVGLPKSLVNTQHDNFAPRLGFAWRPFRDNKTVLRSGYGVFYTGSRLNPIRTDLTGGFPFSISQTFNRQPNNIYALTLDNPFPPALASIQGVTSSTGYEVDAPSSYLQSWNLTMERDVIRGIAVELAYAGSKGTHLGRKYDINQAYRQPGLQLPDGSYPRPIPRLNTLSYYGFGSDSSYEAGTLAVRKRFEKGLFFRFNYTFGKSIDTASGLNYAGDGGFASAQDARNLKSERGRSDFDMRHVASLNFSYEIPLHRNALVRGWQLAGTGRFYSGQPFTPQLSNGNISQGEPTRPDRIRHGSVPSPGPERWYDVSAFPLVPLTAFRFGNSGRNILDGPGYQSLNLALSRRFRLGERADLQFRWEGFNVTNHTNFNLPNVNVDVANAATITSAQAARVLQFGFRASF